MFVNLNGIKGLRLESIFWAKTILCETVEPSKQTTAAVAAKKIEIAAFSAHDQLDVAASAVGQ